MLGGIFPGALVSNSSGITPAQAASIGNGGGAGPVKDLSSANYSAPLSENGYTYTNYSAVGVTITLPASAPLGTTLTLFAPAAGTSAMAFRANAGETIIGPAGSSTVAGLLATSGGTGVAIMVRKTSSTTWGIMAASGSFALS